MKKAAAREFEEETGYKVKKIKHLVTIYPNVGYSTLTIHCFVCTKVEKIKKIEEKKQNPEKEDDKIKQVSEFEKDEMFDPNQIAALIDKSKEEMALTNEKSLDVSQSQDPTMNSQGLTLTEEDALKAQIFGCWSIPLGLPYNENLLV